MVKLVVAGLVIIIGVIGFLYYQHYSNELRTQLLIVEQMKKIQTVLHSFQAVHGEYPENLESVRDAIGPELLANWNGFSDYRGHPFVYSVRAGRFVLLSVGRDGVQDGDGDAELSGARPINVCGDWSADQVLTSDGWVACCFTY